VIKFRQQPGNYNKFEVIFTTVGMIMTAIYTECKDMRSNKYKQTEG